MLASFWCGSRSYGLLCFSHSDENKWPSEHDARYRRGRTWLRLPRPGERRRHPRRAVVVGKAAMSPSFPIVPGATGAAVADLQRKLASLDRRQVPGVSALQELRCANPVAGMTPCGTYGPETVAAVDSFKRRYGLGPEDGVCDESTWTELNLQAGSVFAEVWQYELDALLGGPVPAGVAPAADDLATRAHDQQLAGLAFSGGGIRSATFNLGILQALAELKLLRDIDYLSTVSGGGYIGAWFSRWLDREKGNIGTLESALTPGTPSAPHGEADEIKFLRQYTNYLTPRTGFFSADTWALLATYVRNTSLNLAILLGLLAAVMVVPRLLVTLVNRADHGPLAFLPAWMPPGMSQFSAAALVCVVWAVAMIAANIALRPDRTRPQGAWIQRQLSVLWLIVVPLMVAGCLGSIALWHHRGYIAAAVAQPDPALLKWIGGAGLVYFGAWFAGWLGAQLDNLRRDGPAPFSPAALCRDGVGHFLCAVLAMAVGTLAVLGVTAWLAGPRSPVRAYEGAMASAAATATAFDGAGAVIDMTVPVVAFGMPVLLSMFGFTMVLCVGLVGRSYSDRSREWWSRQSGWTTIIVTGWVALVAVSLYAPALLAYCHAQSRGWVTALLATSWFATTTVGLLVARSSTADMPQGHARRDAIARLAPPVFSAGALCIVSTVLHHALPAGGVGAAAQWIDITGDTPFYQVLAAYDLHTLGADWRELAGVALGLAMAGVGLAWRVDINKFSLHMMYRNRLVRAYLGASNTARAPHPFTGFDAKDDMQMEKLLKKDNVSKELQRPYHIVNTALNLVKGKELAWQTRKAAGFAFTPAFCGFELPRMAAPGGAQLAQEALRGCYRLNVSYLDRKKTDSDEDGGVHLGMAMAVSGAAASPSMGFHSSPPLSFLMTLFNVRLGRWFANPAKPVRRPARSLGAPTSRRSAAAPTSPPVGIWYLLCELFGLTDAKSNYLYLSDGGHFENLGVYELVRRRCRLIVVVDAGADGQFDFSDLGNAIRKCSTDLSVEIDIDVSNIDVMKPSEFSHAHCVTGHIRYDKVDPGGVIGTLLYIKPSLLGSEFADILNYRKTNKTFPHQSTIDQWFDETQFETYRSLGYRIGKIALENAVQASVMHGTLPGRRDIASLCSALHTCWDNAERTTAGAAGVGKKLFLVSDRRHGGERRVAPDAVGADRRQGARRA
jgi:hypothetical protein